MDRPDRASLRGVMLGIGLLVLVGCATERIVRKPLAGRTPVARVIVAPDWGPETDAVLADLGWERGATRRPQEAFRALEGRSLVEPSPRIALALAEVALAIGRRTEIANQSAALPWYRDAAGYAGLVRTTTGGDDALLDAARETHNAAVERLLRAARADQDGKDWAGRLAEVGVVVVSINPTWERLRFDSLQVAQDKETPNLQPVHRRDGWGVPLVAGQEFAEDRQQREPVDRFYPRRLRLATTAVARPRGSISGGQWRFEPLRLELRDPIEERVLVDAGPPSPLAADLTTPLADQFADIPLRLYEYQGILNPTSLLQKEGVYMSTPYHPGKIPVLFVHGLWSSPRTWLSMLNELRADPELSARYQFWFAAYSTGFPVVYNAKILRDQLRELRRTLDPLGQDPALNQMVVVGHSMGCIVTRPLIQQSGDVLDRTYFRGPPDRLTMSPSSRQILEQALHFEPEPYIRRVLFIAGPHRGSPLANQPVGRISSSLVRRTGPFLDALEEIRKLNGRDSLRPPYDRRTPTGIDNLEIGSPVLRALGEMPFAPWVELSSIVGHVETRQTAASGGSTDGVVPYESAHLDGVPEIMIEGRHTEMNKLPATIAEVRSVLSIYLNRIPDDVPTATAPRAVQAPTPEPVREEVGPPSPSPVTRSPFAPWPDLPRLDASVVP